MSVLNFVGLVGVVPSCHCAFVGISWIFFSWVFRGSKIFLVVHGPKFFFSWVFRGSQFFCEANIVIQRFSVVGCMRKSDRKQK